MHAKGKKSFMHSLFTVPGSLDINRLTLFLLAKDFCLLILLLDASFVAYYHTVIVNLKLSITATDVIN